MVAFTHDAASPRTGSLEPVEDHLREALQARLDGLLAHARPVDLLDAGCGHRMPIPVAADLRVVGIDIDPTQLRPDLDEAIVGDLEVYDLGRERFDAVICWNVLEHVTEPVLVVGKFIDALRPRGVLILAVPNVASVKGLVTKYTPHRFHTWVWRRLLGAGPGHRAFPTVLSRSLAPDRLRRFAHDRGLSIEFASEYEAWTQKRLRGRLGLHGRTFGVLTRLVSIGSARRLTLASTDVVVVLRKPE